MAICPRCRAINRPGSRFCGHCGATIASGIPCPACGAMNRPTAHFCGGCRTALRVQCPQCGRDNRPSARFCGGCRATLTSPVSPPARFGTGQIKPQTIVHGRYQVLGLVARGGMGAVYQAADTHLQGKVWALKEMSKKGLSSDERQTAIEQFQQEALMLATLHHRNLPQVVDVFEEGGKHYLVMEYIEGQTLEEILQAAGGPLPEPRVMGWAEQLCDVLGYLHAQKPPIIYRDLKPANVMEENQTGTVKLIDFGIARFHKKGKTRDTVAIGTPGYAPPEQYGKGQSDARSDVYALGVLLHQLLTGYDPSQNPFCLLPVSTLNPDISDQVGKAISKATELEMADRYQSASAFWQAMAPLAPAPPKPKPAKPQKTAPAKKPRLKLTTRRLDFGNVTWGETRSQSIRVKNSGGKVLRGKAESDVGWLHITPETFSGNDEELTVSVDSANLTFAPTTTTDTQHPSHLMGPD